ncbi:MAG: single-stranded-DNA-specific exonuclease RecJ [Acidobacteriota bacterium]
MSVTAVWSRAPVPEAAAELEAAGHPSWLAALLARRGVHDADEAESFLAPTLDDLHDPRRLAGIDAAVARLARAREAGETVAIVGDYDVDGVSGTALLTAVFGACGLDVVPILPHRLRDGYGFQPAHVEKAQAGGATLVVTVDCGTTSIEAARAALDAGLEVIVTDHHLPGTPLPEGVLLVNPRQPECEYPFPDLSGAGLAFKLAVAFADACDRPIDPRVLLRIACLGTVADLVPLRGENRVIAALGLRELPHTRSLGLRALIDVARLQAPYTADDIGYRLGPRLNAPGRVGSAEPALELLLTRDRVRAVRLARELDARNRERQEWERRVAEQARETFVAQDPLPPFLIAWSKNWHRGVVGIAAGRIAKELQRPTVLLAVQGAEAVGSGRSIEGVHLFDFLSAFRDRLPRFGGHAQAIGLTAETAGLEELKTSLLEAAQVFADRVGKRRHVYELDLQPADVGDETMERLARLEPFGQGNRKPLTRIVGPLRLTRAPRLFGRGHLDAEAVGPDRATIRLLGWGWAQRAEQLSADFEALGYLEHDRYRDRPVLRLVDIRRAGTPDAPS